MLRVYIWNYILKIHIDLKMNSDQNGGNSEQKSKKKTFVNSQILSLTTQNDLGVLVPPLTLTFGHITNVRYQKFFPRQMFDICCHCVYLTLQLI